MKLKCDNCNKQTINVSLSKPTSEGFTATIDKCTNCGYQKDINSLLEDFKNLNEGKV